MSDGEGGIDPSIAAILSILASSVATAILRITSYYWPAGRNKHDDEQHRHAKHRGAPPSDEQEEDQ